MGQHIFRRTEMSFKCPLNMLNISGMKYIVCRPLDLRSRRHTPARTSGGRWFNPYAAGVLCSRRPAATVVCAAGVLCSRRPAAAGVVLKHIACLHLVGEMKPDPFNLLYEQLNLDINNDLKFYVCAKCLPCTTLRN